MCMWHVVVWVHRVRGPIQIKNVPKSGKSPQGGEGSEKNIKKSKIRNLDFLIRGEGGGSRKLWAFSTFWDIFYFGGFPYHPSRIHYVLVFFFLKCRKAKYVQRRVCFVIVQVPCPHSNIYVKLCTSRLCIKMSSFLFVRGCAMPRLLYLSCEVPFPVWTPDDISGLISVVPWLSREELSKKNCSL